MKFMVCFKGMLRGKEKRKGFYILGEVSQDTIFWDQKAEP